MFCDPTGLILPLKIRSEFDFQRLCVAKFPWGTLLVFRYYNF